jgi:hypothetical protein
MVNYTNREFITDDVYSSKPTKIKNIHSKKPYFGDHLIIMLDFDSTKPKPEITSRRSLQNYTKRGLYSILNEVD